MRRDNVVALGSVLAMWLAGAAAAQGAADDTVPVRLGVDTAGFGTPDGLAAWVEAPATARMLEGLGARFIVLHLTPVTGTDDNAARTGEVIAAVDRAMRARGWQYTLNVEYPNFVSRWEVAPGVDEFEHPGGLHRWDLRMNWLEPLLADTPALQAITYDECEHMQLSNNKFAGYPGASFDKPFLADTRGLELTEAWERLVDAARRLRVEHYQGRVRLQTEQVWPDLFHIFARAGWTITPKLLKENLSGVVMPIALGAALQYRAAGTALWASPDLWNRGMYPGHSPEALRSALLTGYWLGAETIYVENLDYHGPEPRHPLAGPAGSLVARGADGSWSLTDHGEVVRGMYRTYFPAHPRPIHWSDYDPRVAIIRLPDGGWGQFSEGPGHGEAASRNRLLGSPDHPLDGPASEWLAVWPILTHGAARPGAISSNNPFVYPDGVEEFFVPVDSVAVFDHTVGAPLLERVDCLIVCGHALSEETFQAVRARVAAGATCIIARRLFDQYSHEPLPGDWLVTDRFDTPDVAAKLAPFLGPPDVARYRFRRHVVEFRRGDAPDRVEVTVTPRADAAG